MLNSGSISPASQTAWSVTSFQSLMSPESATIESRSGTSPIWPIDGSRDGEKNWPCGSATPGDMDSRRGPSRAWESGGQLNAWSWR
ncbi:hypothetical protein OGAPHI_003666 [Ogataea philodendri]|uniref:Uncharacterized protein n=1 Tax=Ogataea philodendri TaxID=1378263 RepID=A0A9P8T526_9ASCO|nr:uncharacterized protein OGAPHI_003666 [Ogataea philodendri]KAH3665481.1 hypothetical protein OGAPHI_003666 [Ogataea philodendri]